MLSLMVIGACNMADKNTGSSNSEKKATTESNKDALATRMPTNHNEESANEIFLIQ